MMGEWRGVNVSVSGGGVSMMGKWGWGQYDRSECWGNWARSTGEVGWGQVNVMGEYC